MPNLLYHVFPCTLEMGHALICATFTYHVCYTSVTCYMHLSPWLVVFVVHTLKARLMQGNTCVNSEKCYASYLVGFDLWVE